MLYEKMQDVFDPRIIKPYENHARVIYVNNKYLSLDIYYFKTKTNVG